MTASVPPEKDAPDACRPPLSARVVTRIAEIDAAAWDACAGAANPFVSHAFLTALEESGSATRETGWLAQHVAIETADGRLLGAVPMYLKSHSYGEYVFDHGWAAAYERAGGSYYPKLQVAVPFTPVTGPRLLVHPDADEAIERALVATCQEVTARLEASSLHVTFPTEGEFRRLGEADFLLRTDVQFHWENKGYESFDEFLSTLASRKRKSIRYERRTACAEGVTVETLTGDAIEERHWDAFFAFYQNTGNRKWGVPYLTRDFFRRLGETMSETVVLVMASRDGRPIAGALNLRGADTLYGRNWGCVEDRKFLHFEACYYRAIDYAIENGLASVEAGAQGPHKLSRGYLPRPTYSAHWIRDPGLRDAIAQYLQLERRQVDYEIGALAEHGPFRKSSDEA